MIKCISLFSIVCLISIVISKNSYAQVVNVDSSSQQGALNNAVNLYNVAIGSQSPIYNGPEYSFYDFHIKGNAYFSDVNVFTTGSVYYDGTLYKNIPMLYDLNIDQLAVLFSNHTSKFTLLPERLKSFDYLNHHFINFQPADIGANSIIKPGIYDELYNGKSEILVKRSKTIQTSSGGATGIDSYFNYTQDLYLRRNNIYYSFGGQKSLLNLLKEKKKELKQYIKTNNIKYRDNPEDAMVKIVNYYDRLTK